MGRRGSSAYLRRFERADERTRTADLISSRVMRQALQGFARACETRISKGVSILQAAVCCTVLGSRWCQSGVKPFEKPWSGVEIARPHALGSHSYCKIYPKR